MEQISIYYYEIHFGSQMIRFDVCICVLFVVQLSYGDNRYIPFWGIRYFNISYATSVELLRSECGNRSFPEVTADGSHQYVCIIPLPFTNIVSSRACSQCLIL